VIKALRTFRVRPTMPPALAPLTELALNLRWAWHQPTRELFARIDPLLWEEAGQNPVALLGRLSQERLRALAEDAEFTAGVAAAADGLDAYLNEPRWAQAQDPRPPRVAYFSPEFGLTHVMQTYSGGLGILAGDHLKAASDLGMELVAVGLLYRHGYFRQWLDADGWQQEHYPDLNPFGLPLRRLERDGEAALVEVPMGGHAAFAQIWWAQVGRVPLLLLDTDVPQNAPDDRTVTDKLYGGDREHRVRQELVLGVGGVRALRVAEELGVFVGEPDLWHSNEGHAGFLQMERVRRLVLDLGMNFEEALEGARARVLFTTHTPVPAGIDMFPRALMDDYFAGLAEELGIDMDRLMAIGQPCGADPEDDFNMALMGLRLSAGANGVSQLHGLVSREMFRGLWPGFDVREVPISSVTNGVHAPTWVGPEMRELLDRSLPGDWADAPEAWDGVADLDAHALWDVRRRARARMVEHVRRWVRWQHERRGESPAMLRWTDELLDPEALTVGFARRFAEYKRGTLLLRQPERLRALLESADRPVQFVFAGKSHPRDDLGKDLIRQIVHFSADPDVRLRLVFVEDYDMDLAGVLLAGVDVWLNNPRRPHEACGTSGMKAVLNGGLHCSTLDGWWDEMYADGNGFAIGGQFHTEDAAQQDAADGQALFDLLEQSIVPMFYERGEDGLPHGWLDLVRRSLAALGPRVLATRMVREYSDRLYTPLAAQAAHLCQDGYRRAQSLAGWKRQVRDGWADVRIVEVATEQGPAALGEHRALRARVALGRLGPDDVRVELLHGDVSADGTLRDAEVVPLALEGVGDGAHLYAGGFDAGVSGEYGLTVRVVPQHPDLPHWTDAGLVAWAMEGDEGK
jgi:starch phosphorylase